MFLDVRSAGAKRAGARVLLGILIPIGMVSVNVSVTRAQMPTATILGLVKDSSGAMAGNHSIEMEVREFTKMGGTSPSQRDLWEVVYVILKGEGHETLQRDGEEERQWDWKAGDAFTVDAMEYHNHVPLHPGARFLQMKVSGYFRNVGIDKYLFQNKPTDGETPKFNTGEQVFC